MICMQVHSICIKNDGYVGCKSGFYTALDVIDGGKIYEFSQGLNFMYGDIDSGNWAVSYLLSMYEEKSRSFILSEPPLVNVNGEDVPLTVFAEECCYMDTLYPLFRTTKSVKSLIEKGIKKSGLHQSAEEVIDIFSLDKERAERPVRAVGNERFRAMAAIGYSYGKQVFCFPWMSNARFQSFHGNISMLLPVLENLGKTVILPLGK